ncbi:MAG: carbohydrate ABC transporter permease [Lachnospiraceae bacterium]|nr:carbohydrate ABC transporter permease [Lachnospiraceae bacterium]MBO4559339.1 carbohydrate ABC transporter permease [Lachnospiraceae bacterium]MBR5733170.1 carbohydrate ABC transporter permease [Lachnospiraceae bacterium]
MSEINAIEKEQTSADGSRAIIRFRISDIVIMLIVGLLCLTCVLPFWHVAVKSISSNAAVASNSVFLWPKELSLGAYRQIVQDGELLHSMWFSLWITALFTALGMIACTCAAYPLSRKRLKGRAVLTFLLMVPMYFSAGTLPTYLLYYKLKLIDNFWVLILPLIYSAYNMMIMKNFFLTTIPDELEESASLDGATNFQILFRIMLPLSKPILATLSLFYAVGRWNAYSDNMYFTTKESLKMAQYKLYQMVLNSSDTIDLVGESTVAKSSPAVLQAASIMVVTIPILVIYPFVQKYFVKGTMVGAVKG